MLFRFCLYGFLKNQRYFEPFLMLAFVEAGLSFFAIGWLIGIQSVVVNVLEIPSGVLADAWGRRACMITSFVAYTVGFILFAFAGSFIAFVPAVACLGIGDSFRTGSHKAMIFEWLRSQGREDERTRIYGLTRSWSKFGSALSAVLAAVFVIITGNYQQVFLLSTIPCLLNIVNFLGYPKYLDGAHTKATKVRETLTHFRNGLRDIRNSRTIRQLMTESMAWDGLFLAIKDYLQPVLALLAAGGMARWIQQATGTTDGSQSTATALLVGLVYTALFLLSAISSRMSHRLLTWFGSERAASRALWIVQLLTFVVFTVADCQDQLIWVATAFVIMNVTQNLWRPILIGRYDQSAPPEQGATIMSIESQARRAATLVLAPAVGLAIDWASRSGDATSPSSFWPIGVVGIVCSLWIVSVNYRETSPATPVR